MGALQPLGAATACVLTLSCAAVAVPDPAFGQAVADNAASASAEVAALRGELNQARAQIAEQDRKLAEQQRRLDLIEQRMSGLAQTTQQIRDNVAAVPRASSPAVADNASSLHVGEPPRDSDRPPTVAVLDQQGSVVSPGRFKTRDLQIGRLLMGISQKFSDRIQINWSVEVGATQDVPDVRTLLRIPILF